MIEAVYTLDNTFLGLAILATLIVILTTACLKFPKIRIGMILSGVFLMMYNIILLNTVFNDPTGWDYFIRYYVFGILTIMSVFFIWIGIIAIWKKG